MLAVVLVHHSFSFLSISRSRSPLVLVHSPLVLFLVHKPPFLLSFISSLVLVPKPLVVVLVLVLVLILVLVLKLSTLHNSA